MIPIKSFASDNSAGVHPDILKAILQANQGHTVAYGDDPFTRSAIERFQEHFGANVDVHFVYNGTAANVLGLKAITQPFHAILCSEKARLRGYRLDAREKSYLSLKGANALHASGCFAITLCKELGLHPAGSVEPSVRIR